MTSGICTVAKRGHHHGVKRPLSLGEERVKDASAKQLQVSKNEASKRVGLKIETWKRAIERANDLLLFEENDTASRVGRCHAQDYRIPEQVKLQKSHLSMCLHGPSVSEGGLEYAGHSGQFE